MKNEPSFYEKQHVVLWKTIRRFMENNTSFLEGILCSLGKDLKLGIRYDKLKINPYFCHMLKNVAQIVLTRHRSVSNFIVNLLAGMAAYVFYDAKPSINMEFEMEGEAEVKQLTLF